jgi:hypothetical protein
VTQQVKKMVKKVKYSSPFCTEFCLEWYKIILKANYIFNIMNYREFQKRFPTENATIAYIIEKKFPQKVQVPQMRRCWQRDISSTS